ncbi:MAG: rhomboid family intramembrane serine protease [Bacteroidia bacterium]|nr:rhomboid family intramembrane serine protease [Bacteroidia bacterium]
MSYQEYRPSNFQILPPVIKNILIINIIFLFAQFVLRTKYSIELSEYLGLHYFLADKFRIYQAITYMFMHGDFFHLLSNMFALWMFGSVLENFWGPKRFLTFYLVTGLGAAITHYVIFYFQIHPAVSFINDYIANPDLKQFEEFVRSEHFKPISEEVRNRFNDMAEQYNNMEAAGNQQGMLATSLEFINNYKQTLLNAPVVVGASGSVFGVLLAFGMLFPNTLLYVYFAIPIKAKYFVIIYGLVELFSGVQDNPGDNVAHFAHLGGMLFGFIMIKYWGTTNRNQFY